MTCRQLDALALALLTACASTPRPPPTSADPDHAQRAVLHYEVRELTSHSVDTAPVEVDTEDFREAVGRVLLDVPSFTNPRQTAQWLMSQELEAELLAEVRAGRVVRLSPLGENTPLESLDAAEVKREYARLCHEADAGSDCLGLLSDGPSLTREDVHTLALAMALRPTLEQVKHSLNEMVEPRAVLSVIVWTCVVYLTLWLLPEPVSKGLAAVMTVALIAWLGVDTLRSLMDGWAALVLDVGKATSFAQVRAASDRFGRTVGDSTAKVLVMVASAVLGGTAAKFTEKLPRLPGFRRAAANAEAQGVRLEQVAQVEQVAASSEGTFSALVRNSATEAAAIQGEASSAAITVIRHRFGNRQVFINGQRWHVPANKSLREIPAQDPVGDQLQAAAQQAARRWSPDNLRQAEREAIREANAHGRYWLARLLERQARGRFVEKSVNDQFRHLKWSKRGTDVIDPATGYRYEVLSGTDSNTTLHGRRMADTLFRMITF